jgi:hypothetical protein
VTAATEATEATAATTATTATEATLPAEAVSAPDVLEASPRHGRPGLRKSSDESRLSSASVATTDSAATAPAGLPAANPLATPAANPLFTPQSTPSSTPQSTPSSTLQSTPSATSAATSAPATDVLETPTRRRRPGQQKPDFEKRNPDATETGAQKPASKRPSFFALLARVLPRVLAALIAVAGVALLAVGGLKATVWAPSDVVVGSLGAHSANFVTAEVGVLSLSGPRLQIQVSGIGSDPVFVGIGRAADVDAYLGDAAADRIVGLNKDKGRLITRSQGSDTAAVLDPASADVWSVSALGQGSATLTWPEPASGQWRLVISTDGARVAPRNVTLTWSGTQPSNPAPAWIAVGVVLLVAGVIVSMMLRARSRDRRRA